MFNSTFINDLNVVTDFLSTDLSGEIVCIAEDFSLHFFSRILKLKLIVSVSRIITAFL